MAEVGGSSPPPPTPEDSNYLTQQPSATVHAIGVVLRCCLRSHPSPQPKNTSEFRCYCLARMNFVGDVVHFATATVLVNDDVATGDQSLRRGVAGDTGCGGSGVEPRGELRDFPGHGGALHHALPPQRRYAPVLGCPCSSRGAALGALAGRPLVHTLTQGPDQQTGSHRDDAR